MGQALDKHQRKQERKLAEIIGVRSNDSCQQCQEFY